MPLIFALFTFILVNNIYGIVPFVQFPTMARIGFPLALMLVVYLTFHGVGIKLVDFKIEIGRIWDGDFARLVIADEISPDSCRLWDIETGRKLDKDVFRKDLGSLTEAYTEVARRLCVLPSNVTHRPKPTLIN